MIFEIILIPILFLLITYICYWLTEYDKIPKWLHYKPFICYKCFSTWSLIGIGICFLIMELIVTGLGLITLGLLNGVAKHLDEKNNTISINDFENDK